MKGTTKVQEENGERRRRWTRVISSYIGELAVVERGVAAPLDAVVGRQLPGALRLEEYDGLGEGILVVEAGGGQRRVQGVAGQHQRREGQGDVGAHAAAVAQCAHGGTTREASTGHLGDMGHANWEATEKEGTRLDSGGAPTTQAVCEVFGPQRFGYTTLTG